MFLKKRGDAMRSSSLRARVCLFGIMQKLKPFSELIAVALALAQSKCAERMRVVFVRIIQMSEQSTQNETRVLAIAMMISGAFST